MILKTLVSVLILLCSCVGWANDFADLSEAGVGTWQEVPFGKMRLLSCSTGVKDLSMVVGGLQVRLDPDWTLKRPLLKPLSEKGHYWIEAPVRPGDGRQTIYSGDVFFPLVYERDPSAQDFELGVKGDFQVCQKEKCLDLPIQIGLSLSAQEANYTSVCPYVIDQQNQVPLPALVGGITGDAWMDGGDLHMAFSGVKNPHIALLQTTQSAPFQIQETRLEKTGVIVHFKGGEPWALGTSQDWILLSNKGIFRVPVQMKDHPVLLPQASPSWHIWLMGWGLFFMMPLLIWWGLGMPKSNKLWKKELLKLGMFFPPVLVGRIMLTYFGAYDIISPYYIIILLGIVCLFPPKKLYAMLGLFLLWPLSFEVPHLSFFVFVLWLVICWVEMMVPFVFLYFNMKEIGQVLRDFKKKNFFLYNFVFLLPTVALLGHTVWGGYHASVSYQNALNPSGLSVVCKVCDSWQQIEGVSFISPDSGLGKALQKIYKREKGEVVVWQGPQGRFVLPPHISPKKTTEFISNLKRYHASHMP